jgi:hypothetical protein
MSVLKYIGYVFCAILLAACSMEGMAEKMVPEDVRADHAAHIDALLAGDDSRIRSAFKDDLDFESDAIMKQMESITAAVPEGKELRRDYVGVNSNASISTESGRSRDIDLISEVQTEAGFMLVTSKYGLDATDTCCRLMNINVESFDASPIRAGLETAMRVAKWVGLGVLLSIILLVTFLIRRSRKRRQPPSA